MCADMQTPVLTLLPLWTGWVSALEASVPGRRWPSPRGKCQPVAHSLCHLLAQELMETVHLHLVKEYIIRLCKRRLVLKTAEQQQQLARHILANADAIQGFCTENVSTTHPPPRPAPRALNNPTGTLQVWVSTALSVS